MSDIFISKSTKDNGLALSLCDVMEENGIDCWIADRDLNTRANESFGADIATAIKQSKALLLILSERAYHSKHVLNEISCACDYGIPVYVFQIEELEVDSPTFSYYLNKGQRVVDLDVQVTGNYEKIITEILIFLRYDPTLGRKYIDLEYVRRKNYKELKRDTLEKRQALTMSIADGEDFEYDKSHFYEKIVRLDVVDSRKDEWKSYRFLSIRNDTDCYTNHIIHKECGEDKAAFKRMRIQARVGGVRGERLNVESLTSIQPNLKQVFRINFKTPLAPGDSMDIFYRIEWPNEPSSYYKDELSQSISLSRYTKGVGELIFGIFEPYKISSSYLKQIDKMNLSSTGNYKPSMIDIQEEPLLAPLHDRELFGIEYTIEKPNAILYQILYKIESDFLEEDEDDFF